jgi:hypothetical protein
MAHGEIVMSMEIPERFAVYRDNFSDCCCGIEPHKAGTYVRMDDYERLRQAFAASKADAERYRWLKTATTAAWQNLSTMTAGETEDLIDRWMKKQ